MKSVSLYEKKCILCGICSTNCPTGAISVDKEKRTWAVNTDLCMKCSLCISQCPKEALYFCETDENIIFKKLPPKIPTKKMASKAKR